MPTPAARKGSRASRPAPKSATSRYRIEAITNAARLLREFTRITPQRSVDELAESLHVSRELTLRTLLTLQQHDLIDATSDGSDVYTLGLAWLRLADVRRRQVGMRQVALPVMRRLRDVLNETVILSIRVGSRRVNIDYVESTQAIRRTSQAGFEAPLHIGSAGRVLMSGLNAEELGGYLKSVPLVRFNSEVAVSESAIRSQLDRIRGQGFTVSMREITPDTAAVSAPIHDHTGAVVAALTISCPVDRFTSSLERACITQVTKGADDVSQTLGFTLNL